MRELVAALIVVPLGVLLVALSVVNRKPVTLGLNPFDASSGFAIEARSSCSARRLCPRVAGWRAGDLAQPGQVAEDREGRGARGLNLAPPGRPAGEGA